MSRSIAIFAAVMLAVCIAVATRPCRPSSEKATIERLLRDYPESRVQDIYKSFCQDCLGPEHLIPDPESAGKYLEAELADCREQRDSMGHGLPGPAYYPAGDRGNYVRVSLSVVLDSLVREDALLDAFVRSANEGRKLTPEQWKAKWERVSKVVRKDFGTVPDAERDLRMIDSLIRHGEFILRHSPAYRDAYHPHYRIVAKEIFETELEELILKGTL